MRIGRVVDGCRREHGSMEGKIDGYPLMLAGQRTFNAIS